MRRAVALKGRDPVVFSWQVVQKPVACLTVHARTHSILFAKGRAVIRKDRVPCAPAPNVRKPVATRMGLVGTRGSTLVMRRAVALKVRDPVAYSWQVVQKPVAWAMVHARTHSIFCATQTAVTRKDQVLNAPAPNVRRFVAIWAELVRIRYPAHARLLVVAIAGSPQQAGQVVGCVFHSKPSRRIWRVRPTDFG